MKNTKLVAWVLVLMLAVATLFTACGNDPVNPTPTPTGCTKLCPSCGKCMDSTCTQKGHEQKCEGNHQQTTTMEKHLILDELGDYGGTYNKIKYGEGAPLNGELDVTDDIYYSAHDYFTMKSSATRTLMSGFAPYQQTMANSDGIACAVMVFNNEGKDVLDEYSEINLVNKYESLTKQTVYRNGATPAGLVKLFKNYGYTATADVATPAQDSFGTWFANCAAQGKYVLLRWQTGLNARWNIVIGYDTMDTVDYIYDDVIILADPFDASDHCQDGYFIYQFSNFYRWWRDMGSVERDGINVAKSGDPVATQELVVVDGTVSFDLTKSDTDPVHNYPEVAPLHHLLNANGTIGGSYGDGRYMGDKGSDGTPADQRVSSEHIEYSYYKYNDYTNMEDNESRLICTGYMSFSQTMSSSCGICSTMSVLQYYGFDWSTVGNYITRTDFVGYDPVTKPTFGGVDENDNGRKQEAIVMIYMQYDSYFEAGNGKVFYNYGGVGSGNLSNVPKHLGYPTDFGRYYRNNFDPAKIPFKTYEAFLTFAKGHLAKDEPIVISWSPTGGHWEVIFGLDDMGTETPYDDVIILGDSGGALDHYRDGYNTLPAVIFYGTWYNSSGSTNQQYVSFTRKAA